MNAPRFFWLLPLLSASVPVAAEPCRLCGDGDGTEVAEAESRRPLTVEIDGTFSFGRLAQTGMSGGTGTLDPASGAVRTDGALLDLGGQRFTAEVRLTGEPGRAVRVSWPDRVTMRSSEGDTAELTAIRSDSPAVVRLDGNGAARVRLGARLEVPPGASGSFRARVPISVEYE